MEKPEILFFFKNEKILFQFSKRLTQYIEYRHKENNELKSNEGAINLKHLGYGINLNNDFRLKILKTYFFST